MTSAFYVRSLTNKKAKRTNQIIIRGVSMSSTAVFASHSFITPCYEKRAHVEEPGENPLTPTMARQKVLSQYCVIEKHLSS